MNRMIAVLAAALLLFAPGALMSKLHAGPQGADKAKTEMHRNMAKMADMMSKMAKMMKEGKMTPERKEKMTGMMEKMGEMMQEMAGPHGEEMRAKHKHDLQKMDKELDDIDYHIGH